MNKAERMISEHVSFELWSEIRYAEYTPSSDPSEDYEKQTMNTVHLVPVHDLDNFHEWMANELGYQDYSNKIYFKKIATLTGRQVAIAYKQLVYEARKMLKKRGESNE